MSFVGKILVVLQLVLSVCFMMFAGAVAAVQTNWKASHDQVSTQLTNTQSELTNLQTTFKNFQDDTASKIQAETEKSAGLQAEVVVLTGQLDAVRTELERTKTMEIQKTELAQTAVGDATARREEALTLRELYEKTTSEKDKIFQEKTALEDEVFALKVQVGKLKEDNIGMLLEKKGLVDLLVKNEINPDLAAQKRLQAPPPVVAGLVMETRKGNQGSDFVEISIGSDDGLLKGHELYVYREANYLGKIQIIHTTSDKAVGTVLQRAKNGIIQKGDNVTTKL